MMSCMFNCPLLWGVLVILIGLKVYLKLTSGICKSNTKMYGRTAIVTGANTGIGKETALDLAKRGAKVILACRDLKRGKEACDEIIAKTGNADVEVQHLDLSSLYSVRKFARHIIDTEPRLHVLVNNAGVSRVGNKRTVDNMVLGMQVNHFGPFLLTCLLVGLLKKSAPSRIVMVSSVMHKFSELDLDDLNFEKSFGNGRVYNCSKLANILTANELSRKLAETGVTANSLHPGVVVTEIWRHLPPVISSIFKFFIWLFCKDAREGAQTSIYLSVSENVDGVSGKYFVDCKEAVPSQAAMDEGLAKKLWEKSETLVGLKPGEIEI